MAASNTDYLRFSAYSIKDLITRKLAQDTKYTDQVYEGSNLAILIDVISYMYQCLMYNVNNAAAESMWSDSQIYENINRLSKIIGYNPKGVTTSIATFSFTNKISGTDETFEGQFIPQFAYIDTGKVDSTGQKVYYSTVEQKYINSQDTYSLLMYNGRWKLHGTTFTSSGDKYQTLTLNGLQSDFANKKYVVWQQLYVYAYNPITGDVEQYSPVTQGLYTDNDPLNGVNIYTENDRIFNLRLNENKTYEITFGNGVNGKIPAKDSLLYVMYLESNGPDGVIEPGDVKDAKLVHSASSFGLSQQMYNKIFADQLAFSDKVLRSDIGIKLSNTDKSSESVEEETVEQIRRNAPEWFKIGNRLVVADDYEYYIKNRFKDNVIDVKCQNNWEYISTFYRWLYNLGVQKHNNAKYYLNDARLTKYDYRFADANDSNNVYLWIKQRSDSELYASVIEKELMPIKTLTAEPVFVKPLQVNFAICAAPDTVAAQYVAANGAFDPNQESYLEITMKDNMIYSNAAIQSQVADVIVKYFDEEKHQLGDMIKCDDILNEIMTIDGVERVRTIYQKDRSSQAAGEYVAYNGVSFATWISELVDPDDTMSISTISRKLNDFEFPRLYNPDTISSQIVVIRKSVGSVNSIQY